MMRMPKRGEKGFTLIELLIVVAILGVLAAVIIPNVTKFFGAGKEEARKTERSTIQLAVDEMMLHNNQSLIPNPVLFTNDMRAFPDDTSVGPDKFHDALGNAYEAGDKPGYLLNGHDYIADNDALDTTKLWNYVRSDTTLYYYTADADGWVHQYDDQGNLYPD